MLHMDSNMFGNVCGCRRVERSAQNARFRPRDRVPRCVRKFCRVRPRVSQLWFCLTFRSTLQPHPSVQPSDHDGTYQTDRQEDYGWQGSTHPAVQGPRARGEPA